MQSGTRSLINGIGNPSRRQNWNSICYQQQNSNWLRLQIGTSISTETETILPAKGKIERRKNPNQWSENNDPCDWSQINRHHRMTSFFLKFNGYFVKKEKKWTAVINPQFNLIIHRITAPYSFFTWHNNTCLNSNIVQRNKIHEQVPAMNPPNLLDRTDNTFLRFPPFKQWVSLGVSEEEHKMDHL